MKKLFAYEWNRLVRGMYFKLSMLFGVAFAIFSAVESFRTHYLWQLNNGVLGDVYPFTITEVWFGMDISTMYNRLFMILFPIFSVLPYALISFEDKQSGYINQMLIRQSRKIFYLVRYVVTFIAGGISVTIPSLLNVMLGALYAPILPQTSENSQAYVSAASFAADLFYRSPLAYIALFLLIDFIWGGLFAVLALSMTDIVKNKYILLAFPFLLHMVVYYLVYYAPIDSFNSGIYSIAPFYFLNPTQIVDFNPIVYLLLSLFLFIVSFGLSVVYNTDKDVL